MVQVGERTGDLKTTLKDIVKYFESQYRLKTSIKSTLMMPAIYLVVGLMVAVFIMVFVMPNFESMFDSVDGVKMPAITQFFMDTGDFITESWYVLLFGGASFITLFILSKKRFVKFQIFLSYIAIKMPIIGSVVQMNNLSRIASTLSQMLNNHVALQDSLATTYDTINNRIYKDLIVQAQKNVNNGDYMSLAFEGHYAVEVVFSRMVSVGERTGDLGKMLKNLSAFYDEDSDVKIERLKKGLEPILLIFIFTLVVIMLLAVMLPSLSFTEQV